MIDISIEKVVAIAEEAGAAIMDIYHKDFGIYEKSDQSPLTEADLASHKIIVEGLSQLSEYPILSEEAADVDWQTRQQWHAYWLIDPLDGTKEFIKKNGEFTVNIAFVENGEPVAGVVYAPVLKSTYVGVKGEPAYKVTDGSKAPIHVAQQQDGETWKVVGSRSHQSPEIHQFLDALPGETELVSMGSSLKLCLVAEGAAHLYPRLGPTSEWDTAAAHAVALAAGARVTELEVGMTPEDSQTPLRYNQKESLLNPYFLVSC